MMALGPERGLELLRLNERLKRRVAALGADPADAIWLAELASSARAVWSAVENLADAEEAEGAEHGLLFLAIALDELETYCWFGVEEARALAERSFSDLDIWTREHELREAQEALSASFKDPAKRRMIARSIVDCHRDARELTTLLSTTILALPKSAPPKRSSLAAALRRAAKHAVIAADLISPPRPRD